MAVSRVFVEIGAKNNLTPEVNKMLQSINELGYKTNAASKSIAQSLDSIRNPGREAAKELEILNKLGATQSEIMKIMGASYQGAGSGLAKLGTAMTDFARNPLQAAQNGVTGLLESIGPLGVGIASIATAAIAAGMAIFKMGSDAAEAAERIQNLSASTGMSVTQVQALQRLGKETGVGDLTTKIEMLNIQLGKPEGGEFTEAILRMNVAVKQGAGAVYYLEEIRKKLSEIPTQTERAEAGAAAFGRRLWHDLAPLVMNTSRSITESMSEIENSAAVMTESQMEGLTALDRELDVHGRAWEGLKNKIGIVAGEITLAFFKIIEARPTWEKLFPDWYKPGAAAAVAKIPDMGAISPTTVQGRTYEDIAKENGELERRLKVIAEQDAIATGIRGKLLDLTIKLREVEAERQKIATESKKGLEFQEERLRQLSSESAALKQAIAAEQARLDAAKKSAAILAELDRQYQKNIDATIAKQLTSDAAWQELDKIIADCLVSMDKLFDTSETGFQKMKADLDSLKFREAFPAASSGETPQEFLDGMIKINEQDRKNREDLSKTAETVADVWRNQVSTIVTDWSRGIADILVSGGDFGKKLTDMFRETAKSILRMMIETLFNPLKNWLSGILSDLFGLPKSLSGGGGGGGGILNSLFSGLSKGIGGGGGGAAISTIGQAGAMGAGTVGIPLANAGMLGGLGLAGTMGTIPMFSGGISAATASAMGAGAYGIPLAGAGTGSLAGAGGAAGAGGGGLFGGMGSALMGIAAAIPVAGWIAIGVAVTAAIVAKVMHKDAWEAGTKEVTRDMGGLKVGESVVKTFFKGLGLTEKQVFDIRKDLLFSPAFISQIAVPAAEKQGRLDALLKSLEKVTVDTKIASSGYLNFRAVVEEGIKTGNWDAFNKAYEAAFKNSKALTAVMPDFASKLLATATAAQEAADATAALTEGWRGLLDAISGDMGILDDMYATFYKTGEILPQLAADILKYGGSLEVFQKYASLGGLKENLAAIGNLISGLNQIMPDLGPIESILQGKGISGSQWTQLQAMGIDPAKLVPMADLVAFETRWEESVRQFQDTGKLMAGSALQQGLYKFGGAAGTTALSRWDQGFNTITPGLLDATKAAMDAAYQTERMTAVDYLKGIQSAMESEIKAAGDAVVAELQKILAAIEAGNAATVPVTPAATTPETVAAQGGVYVDMRGATVYGYEDFEGRVQTAWNTAYRRGAFDYAVS